MDEHQQPNEQEYTDKKKKRSSGSGSRKVKELERAILEQTLIIRQAQDYYDQLVHEYNRLSQGE
jgi:hypothetical protein